jgi:thiamine biosynthesis lipoprotein
MAHKSTRRDFLRGKTGAASDSTERPRSASAGPQPEGDPTPASYAVHVSRQVMACEFEVVLNAGQYDGETEAALEALDLVERLEDELSYFRRASQVSLINQTAAEASTEVEPWLFELLRLAATLHEETDGAFDITATPLWKAWGFSRRQGRIPSDEELAAASRNVGGHLVELDERALTVRFRCPGVELNLGSIGKGYALDRIGEMLQAQGIEDYLLHGGNSSVLARGSRMEPVSSGDAPTEGWRVAVVHPMRPSKRLAEIRLRDSALGTSGSGSQFFRHRGRRYGHVLDPRTGRPAEGVLSATVIAPTAAKADALATAFYVMGMEKAFAYCAGRPELAAILVVPSQIAPGFALHQTGFGESNLRLIDAW